jgi:lysozyme family protein
VLQKVVSAPQAVIHTVEKVITAVAPQQDKFDKLRKSIAELWASMKLSPRKEDEVRRTAKMLLDPWKMEQYRQVEAETGVPALLIAVIHYRESNADFSKSLANGDPWNKRYRRVPKGRGPFASWKDAAIDALRIDELDKVGRENWSMERALFFAEAYNGWGYRYRGLPSAYVWAASSAYRGSKFVGDGRFRRNAWDDQLGVAPLMAEMISLDPTLVIPVEVAKIPADHPAARGYSVYAALQLQP